MIEQRLGGPASALQGDDVCGAVCVSAARSRRRETRREAKFLFFCGKSDSASKNKMVKVRFRQKSIEIVKIPDPPSGKPTPTLCMLQALVSLIAEELFRGIHTVLAVKRAVEHEENKLDVHTVLAVKRAHEGKNGFSHPP